MTVTNDPASASLPKFPPRVEIVASGRRIDLTPDPRTGKIDLPGRKMKWHENAWRWYDNLGPIRYAHDWRASQVADHNLIPVFGNERLPLRLDAGDSNEDDPENAPPLHGLSDDEALDVEDAVARLQSYEGTHAALLRGLAKPVSVTGISYVLGYMADEDGRPSRSPEARERFLGASEEEISIGQGGTTVVYDNGNESERMELNRGGGDSDLVDVWLIEIMTRHPRRSGNPTSPMEALQQQCMTLYYLIESILGDSTSKTPAGLLLYASEIEAFYDAKKDQGEARGRGRNQPDTSELGQSEFAEKIIQPLIDGVTDPSSPFRMAPVMLGVPQEYLETVKHLRFHNQNSDTETVSRINALLRYIAISMDMPVEMLLGLGEAATHATARQIERSSYEDHVEPFVRQIADALTAGYLWPELVSRGWDPQRARSVRIGWLYRGNLGVEDRAEAIFSSWDRLLLSDQAARRELGYHERDAPGPEEVGRRLTQHLALNGVRDTVRDMIEELMGVTILDPTPDSERDSRIIANPTDEERREVERRKVSQPDASTFQFVQSMMTLAVEQGRVEGLQRIKRAAAKDVDLKGDFFERPGRSRQLTCEIDQLGEKVATTHGGWARVTALVADDFCNDLIETFADQIANWSISRGLVIRDAFAEVVDIAVRDAIASGEPPSDSELVEYTKRVFGTARDLEKM